MAPSGGGAERRKQRRVPMRLPVRVQGRDADGTTWEEMTTCEDASAGGVGLQVKRKVVLGQVLHLSLPLPPRFRQFDLTDPSYRVYGLVRNARPAPGGGVRIGVLFLGKFPPPVHARQEANALGKCHQSFGARRVIHICKRQRFGR